MRKISFDLDETNEYLLNEVRERLSKKHEPIKISLSDAINYCIWNNPFVYPRDEPNESNKKDTQPNCSKNSTFTNK